MREIFIYNLKEEDEKVEKEEKFISINKQIRSLKL